MSDLASPKVMLAGLVEMRLPSRTVRLCDGGFVYFQTFKYVSHDTEFGSLGGFGDIEEGSGDEAPGFSMTLLPSNGSSAAALSQPAYQFSRVLFWLVRVNEQTGVADDATAELVADMLIDTTSIRFGRGSRAVEIGLISSADRLMNIDEGNRLSSRFHKSVWPGELGYDNAIDVGVTVAWRVAAPPRGSVVGGKGEGGGGFDSPRLIQQ